jgi:predicted nucleic-acid-binding protein
MRAVDTNVLVRLITRDDPRQVAAAEAFVAGGAWVSHLAMAEATWVLESVYGRDSADIATAVEMLLSHEQLSVQDAEVVEAAVAQFRQQKRVGFSDCLMLEVARKAGHTPLGTFDRALGKIDGAHRLT